jgi:hypothetical protein
MPVFADSGIYRYLGETIANHRGGSQVHEGGGLGRVVTNYDGNYVNAGGSRSGRVIAEVDGDRILDPSSGGTLARISGTSHIGDYKLSGSPSPMVIAALFMAARQLGK